MRTIAVINQKGGCAKTTTSVSLAGCLAAKGHRVLVVDMDPQAHATLALGIDPEQLDENLYRVLAQEPQSADGVEKIIVQAAERLDVAPSGIVLSALEHKLAAEGAHGRTERLAQALEGIEERYDFVLIDCPPNVGILTFNALRAAREVIVPVETSYFALHGVAKLLETVRLLEERIGHPLSLRLLPTMFDGRTRSAQRALAEIRENYTELVYDTVIRHNVRLREAVERGVTIAALDRRSYGFVDYMSVALELLFEDQARGVVTEARPRRGTEVERAETGVVFTYTNRGAQQVQLAGDFNGWAPDRGVETRQGPDGTWEKIVQLGPGVYQYRYIVDGEWQPDPSNPRQVEGLPGAVNSVLVVA